MRKFLFAAMALFMVLGVAPAGAAELSADTTIVEDTIDTAEEIASQISIGAQTQIPFSVTRTVNGTTVSTPSGTNSTGFVGFCDVGLDCYGFQLNLTRTAGTVSVGNTSVTINGVICVRDYSAPCGEPGSAGTGVIITQRDVSWPYLSATTPSIHGRLCVWIADPRFGGDCPSDTLISDLDPISQTINTPGELELFAGLIPDRLVVQTP